ncbi:MAG: hydantoinase/oxoprolinase family protein [Actinobacteria bacterium]|nr:hydantoinase/oxoprolinase family protein [Actinomycetota bacterium]
MSWTAGVDIGGTFTDTVVMDDDGAIAVYKSLTTPGNLLAGLLDNLRAAAADRDCSLEEFLDGLVRIAHGTTAATNAYIERRAAKVALITTRGFEDVIFMQRMLGMTAGLSTAELTDYSLRSVPEPICDRSLVFGVRERVDYEGEEVGRLREEDVAAAIESIREQGVEAVAISLLWSFKNPDHERRIAELLRRELPGVYVSVSSELVPRLGEYERTATTLINAYLGPIVAEYTRTLTRELPGAPVMLLDSSGGVMTPEQAGEAPVRLLLSGPSGGVTACQYLGQALGHGNVITFDMGGTSTDVGLVVEGEPVQRHETEFGKYHLLLPMVDVRAIGAGGGSIAYVEDGAYLQVGRESAGARPGPACYGLGGTKPTVTDADLVLGILGADNPLAGSLQLDLAAAGEAIERHVAAPLGISVTEAAAGIKRIVDTRMADLLRTVTLERGYDPRDFTLHAYGGAGPSHAPAFGLEVVESMVIPFTQSVHSALGAIASDVAVAAERALPLRLERATLGSGVDPAPVERAFGELDEQADRALAEQGVRVEDRYLDRLVEVRFARQTKALLVRWRGDLGALLTDFQRLYAERYGSEALPERAGFELVTCIVRGRGRLLRPELGSDDGRGGGVRLGSREVFDPTLGEFRDTDVYDGLSLRPGEELGGPLIIQYPTTTIALVSGQLATVDRFRGIEIRRAA